MHRTSEPAIQPLTEKCGTCSGEGKVPTRHGYETCGTCKGSGSVSPSRRSFDNADVSARGRDIEDVGGEG